MHKILVTLSDWTLKDNCTFQPIRDITDLPFTFSAQSGSISRDFQTTYWEFVVWWRLTFRKDMLAQFARSTKDMSPGRQVQRSQWHGIQILQGHPMNPFYPCMKMKERRSFETSVNIHRTTQHHTSVKAWNLSVCLTQIIVNIHRMFCIAVG